MNRKSFIKSGFAGLGAIIALPSSLASCNVGEENPDLVNDSCMVSPSETKGPFPILTPTQLIKSSIIGDRTGVALLMTYTITDQSNGCTPLAGVLVDVWHCDKDGNYSQYNSFTSASFLRGRQTTDSNGQVSFLSIFPGWYSGRAPHIHLEVLTAGGSSLLVTQVAFPVDVYNTVYASTGYRGAPDTSNSRDGIFSDSLAANLSDSCTGNVADGYTLKKTITVS